MNHADWTRVPTLTGTHARLEPLPGLGHLAHEEAPGDVTARIAAFLAETG